MMLAHLDVGPRRLQSCRSRATLEAAIPGYGPRKVNESFTLGGSNSTAKTVKGLLWIEINEVVEIDFEAFQRAVNRLECFHQDIDRSYFNDNSRRRELRDDRREVGLPVAVRQRHVWTGCASATPTTISSAAPASRSSCAQPRRRCLSKAVVAGNDLVKIFRHYTRTDIIEPRRPPHPHEAPVESGKHDFRSVRFRAYDKPGSVEPPGVRPADTPQ